MNLDDLPPLRHYEAVVSAARLASVGADDEEAELVLLRALIAKAPESSPDDVNGPSLLVDTIKELKGTWRVMDPE